MGIKFLTVIEFHHFLNWLYVFDFPHVERLVVELLVRMGYIGTIKEAGQEIGRTDDEGICFAQ